MGQDHPSVPGEPHMTMPTNLRRGASAIALGLAVGLSFAELAALAMAEAATQSAKSGKPVALAEV